jgi:hypothetical protein
MDARGLGIALIWAGVVLLAAVLWTRLRQGALGEDAFDNPPPVPRWVGWAAVLGFTAAVVGTALTVWSFL